MVRHWLMALAAMLMVPVGPAGARAALAPAAPEETPAATTGPVDEKQPFKETF